MINVHEQYKVLVHQFNSKVSQHIQLSPILVTQYLNWFWTYFLKHITVLICTSAYSYELENSRHPLSAGTFFSIPNLGRRQTLGEVSPGWLGGN